MKSFAALALFSASASASFSKLISFDFNEYFTESERRTKPALGAYSYGYSLYTNSGTTGLDITVSGDINAEINFPFENTDDEVSWYFELKPEITIGGTQTISFNSPYFATDFFIDLWPADILIGDTYLQFTPPTFTDFCMSSGWSLTLLDLAVSMDLSLWQCDGGLFDYILNGTAYNCGLHTYTFSNDLYDLAYSSVDMAGDFLANTCDPAVPEDETTNSIAVGETTTTVPVSVINAEWW